MGVLPCVSHHCVLGVWGQKVVSLVAHVYRLRGNILRECYGRDYPQGALFVPTPDLDGESLGLELML